MLADTGEVPTTTPERPALHSFETEAWNAFCRLSSRRQVSGFGSVSAISYTEIANYLDLVVGIDDPEDRQVFIELIDHLDGIYLNEVAEKQKKEATKTKSKRKPT